MLQDYVTPHSRFLRDILIKVRSLHIASKYVWHQRRVLKSAGMLGKDGQSTPVNFWKVRDIFCCSEWTSKMLWKPKRSKCLTKKIYQNMITWEVLEETRRAFPVGFSVPFFSAFLNAQVPQGSGLQMNHQIHGLARPMDLAMLSYA